MPGTDLGDPANLGRSTCSAYRANADSAVGKEQQLKNW